MSSLYSAVQCSVQFEGCSWNGATLAVQCHLELAVLVGEEHHHGEAADDHALQHREGQDDQDDGDDQDDQDTYCSTQKV